MERGGTVQGIQKGATGLCRAASQTQNDRLHPLLFHFIADTPRHTCHGLSVRPSPLGQFRLSESAFILHAPDPGTGPVPVGVCWN